MYDLLTPSEDTEAAAQGWGLHYVYDSNTGRWGVRILPIAMVSTVVGLARINQPTALKALRLMVEKPKGKK